jgi:predicted Zn-dependent protease
MRSFLYAGLASICISGCVSTTHLDNSTADGKKVIVVGEQAWQAQSAKAYKKLINQMKKSRTVVIDPKLQRLMDQMLPHTSVYHPDSSEWQWEINAQLSGVLNASSFAGGKILVNTGMYWQLQLSDDELAFVIAHEMAHALLDHRRKKVAASLFLGSLPTYLSHGVSQTWLHESEADILALELMQHAGMNPQAASTFFEKFQRETERRRQLKADQPLMSGEFMDYRRQIISEALAS